MLPSDLPPPRGKVTRLTTYGDANLMHDHLTGKAVTACLHFINQTPFDWFCKKQSTVETATYGAESTAARTCIEQMMQANKMTLMYLGVPIVGPSVLFGDNQTVVDSGTIPHAKLKKRHLMCYCTTMCARQSHQGHTYMHLSRGRIIRQIFSASTGHIPQHGQT